MKLSLITTVWGKDFTKFFCDYTLPSLLYDLNTFDHRIQFHIASDHNSIHVIKSDPKFEKFSEYIDFNFILLEEDNLAKNKHWDNWHKIINYIGNTDFVMIVIPDCVYVKGILNEIYESLCNGVEFIFFPLPQVCKVFIRQAFPEGIDNSGISRAAAKKLWVDFINPRHAALSVYSPFRVAHPEYVLIPKRNNIVFSEMAGQGFAFRLDSDCRTQHFIPLCPETNWKAIDVGGISCENLLKDYHEFSYYFTNYKTPDRYISYGDWVRHFREGNYSSYSEIVHEVCQSPDKSASKNLAFSEQKLQAVRVRLAFAQALSIFNERFKVDGRAIANQLLGLIVLDSSYYRCLRGDQQYTIFVPIDDGNLKSLVDVLIAKRRIDVLKKFILAHIQLDRPYISPGERISLLLKNNAKNGKCVTGAVDRVRGIDTQFALHGINHGSAVDMTPRIRYISYQLESIWTGNRPLLEPWLVSDIEAH